MKTKKTATVGFVVLWDDNQGVNCPMGWDPDCIGAILCMSDAIAIFETRAEARNAINISTKFAQLRLSQGMPVNVDFIGANRKYIRVVPCVNRPKTKTNS